MGDLEKMIPISAAAGLARDLHPKIRQSVINELMDEPVLSKRAKGEVQAAWWRMSGLTQEAENLLHDLCEQFPQLQKDLSDEG